MQLWGLQLCFVEGRITAFYHIGSHIAFSSNGNIVGYHFWYFLCRCSTLIMQTKLYVHLLPIKYNMQFLGPQHYSNTHSFQSHTLICDKSLMNDDWYEREIDCKYCRLIKFANDVGFAHKISKVSSSQTRTSPITIYKKTFSSANFFIGTYNYQLKQSIILQLS